MSSLALLKQRLAELRAPERPVAPGVATGLDALDRALASGVIPRGRLTEVVGARGSGRTTLVRRVVERAAAAGLWVAYVDATCTLAPRDWAEIAARHEGVWVVRPADPARGAWCADVLLRSGAFGLVVLDGAPPLSRAVAVRLTGLARESEAALVVMGDDERGGGSALGGALRLRVEARHGERHPPHWRRHRQHRHWPQQHSLQQHSLQQQEDEHQEERRHRPHRRFVVAVEKGGIHQTVEVSCAIAVARRLCTHPEVPDRRGVGGRTGGGRGTRDAGRATSSSGGGGRAARATPGGSRRATA